MGSAFKMSNWDTGCVLVRMPRVAMQAFRMKALLTTLIFFLGALVPVQARDDGRYANELCRGRDSTNSMDAALPYPQGIT